jgi:HemY protein
VKGWLARALTVSRGPQWICDNCQHIHAEFQPICENCKSIDTLAWKTPPNSEMAMPGGVQMLPLIVGALEDQATEEPVEAAGEVIEDAEIIVEEAPKDEVAPVDKPADAQAEKQS